jgi:hypothetical protein
MKVFTLFGPHGKLIGLFLKKTLIAITVINYRKMREIKVLKKTIHIHKLDSVHFLYLIHRKKPLRVLQGKVQSYLDNVQG